jgi:hypothetical protein
MLWWVHVKIYIETNPTVYHVVAPTRQRPPPSDNHYDFHIIAHGFLCTAGTPIYGRRGRT